MLERNQYNGGKDNPEKYKALNKRKAENRPEAYKILSREASKRNREEGYQKEWRQNNKDKLKQYNYNHLNKQHEISNEEWESCKKYFNYKCAYCGIGEEAAKETQGHYLHKEHAINSGSNDISNCVPSCRSCNSQKWERDYDEWYTDSLSQFDMNKLNKINKWIKDDHKLYIDSD